MQICTPKILRRQNNGFLPSQCPLKVLNDQEPSCKPPKPCIRMTKPCIRMTRTCSKPLEPCSETMRSISFVSKRLSLKGLEMGMLPTSEDNFANTNPVNTLSHELLQHSLSNQALSHVLGPSNRETGNGTKTCALVDQGTYQPINLLHKYSKVILGRPLANKSPSCSSVSIVSLLSNLIPRLIHPSQNQIVLVW